MERKKILVVEDNLEVAAFYREILKKHTVYTASLTKIASSIIRHIKNFDLLILDVKLPDGNGIDFLNKARSIGIGAPTIIISGNLNPQNIPIARDLGALCAIQKPFPLEMIKNVIESLIGNEWRKLSDEEKKIFVFSETCFDGGARYVSWDDGNPIEFSSILKERSQSHTVCLSPQYGCLMGCHFCATGTLLNKNVRNVHWKEMLSKIRIANLFYGQNFKKREVMVAGEGEGSLNIENVLKLIEYYSGELMFRMATVGLVKTFPLLTKHLARKLKQLWFSLHFFNPESKNNEFDDSDDEIRKQHIPTASKNPLRLIEKEALKFADASGQKIVFNVALARGHNDNPRGGERLGKILKGKPVIVQVAKINPFGNYQPVNKKIEDSFVDAIKYSGVETKKFISQGSAPCGKMSAIIQDKL